MAESYIERFTHLRTDTSAARWSAATNYRAPHKPFLLLAVLDLIGQGLIKTNFIEFNAQLIDTFDLYWTKVMAREKDGNPVLPFFHLRSEGFWALVPTPGMEHALAATRQVRSIGQLRQLVLGAQVDDALFEAMRDPKRCQGLRSALIESYFAPEIRPLLAEVGKITAESLLYGREMLRRARGHFTLKEAPETESGYRAEARSVAFRRIVVEAYDHTCAMCGIRLVTPEGRTAVAAAHIVPWTVSHNDDPRNGVALCGLHHWTFDQGMTGITSDYQINVSPVVPSAEESARPLLALMGRGLRRPANPTLHPAKTALRWHWENIFRSVIPPRPP